MVIPTERMAIPKVATMATTAIKVPATHLIVVFSDSVIRFSSRVSARSRSARLAALRSICASVARAIWSACAARDSGGGHFFAGFERVIATILSPRARLRVGGAAANISSGLAARVDIFESHYSAL